MCHIADLPTVRRPSIDYGILPAATKYGVGNVSIQLQVFWPIYFHHCHNSQQWEIMLDYDCGRFELGLHFIAKQCNIERRNVILPVRILTPVLFY